MGASTSKTKSYREEFLSSKAKGSVPSMTSTIPAYVPKANDKNASTKPAVSNNSVTKSASDDKQPKQQQQPQQNEGEGFADSFVENSSLATTPKLTMAVSSMQEQQKQQNQAQPGYNTSLRRRKSDTAYIKKNSAKYAADTETVVHEEEGEVSGSMVEVASSLVETNAEINDPEGKIIDSILKQMEEEENYDRVESALPAIAPKAVLGNSSMRLGKGTSTISRMLSLTAEVNIDECIQKLLDPKVVAGQTKTFCLKNSEIVYICHQARDVFMSQPPLIRVKAPVKIVGDTHGQYTDLVRLMRLCGFPPESRYLFLGDYVDRGKQSLETILLLLCYKVKHPDQIYILRGNHECASVNKVYGFFDECKRRCSIKIWRTFTDVFNCLPIAAIVSEKIFCVHGGLSPQLKDMNDIVTVKRPTDIPENGILNDLLWSDPSDATEEWEENDRGVSYIFGKQVLSKFLADQQLDLVCRAHMVVEDGYEFFGNRQLVTIFSAPNYCGEFNNCAAVMNVTEELVCSFEILKPQNFPGS